MRGRVLGLLVIIDETLAQRIANGLGWPDPIERVPPKVPTRIDLDPSPALSILAKAKPTLEGRQIGVLVTDGVDPKFLAAIKDAIVAEKATAMIVAPKVGTKDASGAPIDAQFQLAGGSSVLFDAVIAAPSKTGAGQLLGEAAAVAWVHDAYQHVKVIGFTEAAKPLLDKAGALPDDGVLAIDGKGGVAAFLKRAAQGRVWDREPVVRMVP